MGGTRNERNEIEENANHMDRNDGGHVLKKRN